MEVNGKSVFDKTLEDLSRLLSADPDPAKLVVLRKHSTSSCRNPSVASISNATREVATLRSELEVVRERAEEAQRIKDSLSSDNIRLTHRISYLEEQVFDFAFPPVTTYHRLNIFSQVSELLSRKNDDIRIVTQSPVVTSTVKTSQNITNINISSQPTSAVITNTPSTHTDLQVFQKGPQITALVANVPGLEVSKDNRVALPLRSKSSLSNVSNTLISAPSPQPSEHSCYKNHRYRTKNLTGSSQFLDESERKYKKHHGHKERDYGSESNFNVDRAENRMDSNEKERQRGNEKSRRKENGKCETACDKKCGGERRCTDDTFPAGERRPETSVMDKSYKKATKIVQELTKGKEAKESSYEKHRQRCFAATEKYNRDILRHYNARKSASVLDFRSQVILNSKYSESKSSERAPEDGKRLYKKINDVRSVKSLDFDSDCNSLTAHETQSNTDYTSEPLGSNHKKCYDAVDKVRPVPPKKPIRLSLHRAQSLQSVENGLALGKEADKYDTRKATKRNYRGEAPAEHNIINACHPDRNGNARYSDRNGGCYSEKNGCHPEKSYLDEKSNLHGARSERSNFIGFTSETSSINDRSESRFAQPKLREFTRTHVHSGNWC